MSAGSVENTSVALSGNILGSNVWGPVADAHGRRRTLIAVAVLSAVTSALCGFARSYWVRPAITTCWRGIACLP